MPMALKPPPSRGGALGFVTSSEIAASVTQDKCEEEGQR